MKRSLLTFGVVVMTQAQAQMLRPPAVPLVACDPYFSIWSRASRLTDVPTTHWTGRRQRLTSMVRIDGKAFRLMGDEPKAVAPLTQKNLLVTPTRTIYQFGDRGVSIDLTFTTPSLPDDLDLLSRPITYLTWASRSTDGKPHSVQVYFDASAEPSVDEPSQKVVWKLGGAGNPLCAAVGTVDQPVLRKTGDDRRIDWGYFYVYVQPLTNMSCSIGVRGAERFSKGEKLGPYSNTAADRADSDRRASYVFDLGRSVQPRKAMALLAYDDVYSIQYFGRNLRPYWRRNGTSAAKMLAASYNGYPNIALRCQAFDRELTLDMTALGGRKYAQICALAYRQTFAGNKIAADANGQPLLFPKENTSNGCIGTVDVIFPMAPQYLLFGPSLTKAMIVSNLDYASSKRWRWPFAPHDLGTYPRANGQVYGGGERTEDNQMPVEETGNMLILTAALAKMEGNANFAQKYWPTLSKWAAFLKDKGFDPENQLSTDDFMGHLAHNTNLSIKATLGLGSYALLCDMTGRKALGAQYRQLAKGFATRWATEARDGDHFRLAFDKSGTWSQKYNLVWDKILGLNLYSPSVAKIETAYYRKMMKQYGVPLDSREGARTTKLDWSMWSATLTGDPKDFTAIMDPVWKFVNETPDRLPMSDWYDTRNGHQVGFHSRPVVGGVFLRALYSPKVWKKWATRDTAKAANWAPLPTPPIVKYVLPTAAQSGAIWKYTTDLPASDWYKSSFDDGFWQQGPGGFGTNGTPGAVARTNWNTSDIWLRRWVDLNTPAGKLALSLYHDEDAEVYINGKLVARESGYVTTYEFVPFDRSVLKPGKNLIAVHCHQTTGGQGIDLGIVKVVK